MSNVSKETFIKKEDPKYIDLLDEDVAVAGQKFVCLSFVSPEKILKQKELYFFNKFLEQYDLNKSLEKFTQFLNFISYKYKLDFDKLTKDLKEFTDEEKQKLYVSTLDDEYKTYIDNHEDSLESSFNEDHKFLTSTRGIKVRGSYPSQPEAELRCKMLREIDPNHDVFVGPVGTWMPWDPEAYKTGRVEYLEEELNQLMNEKQKNEKYAKEEFEKRLKDARKKAIEDNIEKAKESGNVLTQTVDANGQLVNIKNMNMTENVLLQSDQEVTSDRIHKELFEGDDIVMNKKSDHGLSNLSVEQPLKQPLEQPLEQGDIEQSLEHALDQCDIEQPVKYSCDENPLSSSYPSDFIEPINYTNNEQSCSTDSVECPIVSDINEENKNQKYSTTWFENVASVFQNKPKPSDNKQSDNKTEYEEVD